MVPLLEISGLRTQIHTRRRVIEPVAGVSLTIHSGETLGLVGESGSGKSLTGLSVMRLLPPGGRIAAGSVKVGGREITALTEREMRSVRGNEIAMVFQDPMSSLNPTMTIGQQVAEPVRIHRRVSKAEAWERAAEALNLVGMPKPRERLASYPHQLSGGLRQRVGLAMALACEPKVLIADEPTTALDVTIQAQILELLDDLRARLGMALLLITHDMGVIANRADRVMVMYAGQIVEASETSEAFFRTRHPYTQALLESVPRLETDRSSVLYSIPGLPPDLAGPLTGCRFAARCRYAQAVCEGSAPPLDGDNEHLFACWFPVRGARLASASQLRERDDRAGTSSASGVEPIVVVRNVVKEFPVTKGGFERKLGSVKAVSDVSFAVRRGETFGLVGESGCGKTTLGRMIAGMERPTTGSVEFGGDEFSRLRGRNLRKRRRDVQLMFQDPYGSLDPRMRVQSILREPFEAQGIGTRREQDMWIAGLLDEVGLAASSANLYPHEFSGGQRQRIGLARALALKPRLIVADEPVSALDVSIQAQVLNLMRRIQMERDLTYVVISHDLSVMRYLADHIAVMYLGKIVEVGFAAEVYSRPAHPYTAGLLEAVPVPLPVRDAERRMAPVMGELPSAASPPSGCRYRTRCPRAQAICADVEPAFRPFSAGGHEAACHFPLEEPVELLSTKPEM